MPRKGLRPVEPPTLVQAQENLARRVQHRLCPDELIDLVAVYDAAATIDELATRFRVHRATVLAHLDRSKVKRWQKGLTAVQLGEATALYANGWLLARVGNHFSVSAETIRGAFRRAGSPTRSRQGWNRTPDHP